MRNLKMRLGKEFEIRKKEKKAFNVGFTATKTAFVKARIESMEIDKRLTRLINSSP